MNNILLYLAPVVIIAVILRFFKLKRRGLLHYDDGLRMLEVVFLDELVKWLKQNLTLIRAKKKVDMKEESLNFKGRYLFDTNPLNIIIYYMSSKITKNIEYSALYANAFFGILGIIGVFFTANLMFPGNENLLLTLFSVIFITFSGFHLVYSRSVHSEVTCGAFYIWATYFYLLSLKTGSFALLLIAGLLIGCAFCCNTRQFYMPLFFILWEFIAFFKLSLGFDLYFSRTVLLGTGMLIPLFVIEELFVVLKELNYPFPSFFRQLFFRSGNFVMPSMKLPFFRFYMGILYEYEGIITLFFIASGIYFSAKTFDFYSIILLTQFIVPILFWSGRPAITKEEVKKIDDGTGSYAFALPRLISSAQYSMAIIAAIGFFNLIKSSTINVIIAIASAVLISGILKAIKILKIESGYKKTLDFIMNSGAPRHISYCYPNSEYYTGKENTIDVSSISSEADLEKLYSTQNVRYVLYMKFLHINSYPDTAINSIIEKLTETTNPVFKTPLGMKSIKAVYLEEYNSPWVKVFKNDDIKVFDLKQYYQKG